MKLRFLASPDFIALVQNGEGYKTFPASPGTKMSTCVWDLCKKCGDFQRRCRCMKCFHNPEDKSFCGAIKAKQIICASCRLKSRLK